MTHMLLGLFTICFPFAVCYFAEGKPSRSQFKNAAIDLYAQRGIRKTEAWLSSQPQQVRDETPD